MEEEVQSNSIPRKKPQGKKTLIMTNSNEKKTIR